jgi:pyruvate-ferredoxin/flavodoxin oxidoreductase
VHEHASTSLLRADIDALRAAYDEAMAARETSLDAIAAAMTDLATSSQAPLGGLGALVGTAPAAATPAPAAADAAAEASGAVGTIAAPVWLDPADEALCTDCGTCYQELPQFFEKVTVVIDGAAKVVARMKPGAVDSVQVTPEIQKRIDRVRATCDAEIIR